MVPWRCILQTIYVELSAVHELDNMYDCITVSSIPLLQISKYQEDYLSITNTRRGRCAWCCTHWNGGTSSQPSCNTKRSQVSHADTSCQVSHPPRPLHSHAKQWGLEQMSLPLIMIDSLYFIKAPSCIRCHFVTNIYYICTGIFILFAACIGWLQQKFNSQAYDK